MKRNFLFLLLLLSASSALAETLPSAPVPPVARYPAVAPEPVAAPDPADPTVLRAQRRAADDADIARRGAARDARQAARAREASHQYKPRPVVSVGAMTARVARDMQASDSTGHDYLGRAHQVGVELGLAYTQHFTRWVGVRVGFAASLGASRLVLRNGPALSVCCSEGNESERAAAYGLSLDAAPVISVGNTGFYFSPGAVARLFFLARERAELAPAGEDGAPSVSVSFRSPVPAIGGRLAVGCRFGAHREFDVAFAVDGGAAFRNADRFFGFLTRLSVAFTDIASAR